MFFTCRESFDADDGDRWTNYLRWLGRADLARVVTLDGMLCPPLIHLETHPAWEHAVSDNFTTGDLYTDLDLILGGSRTYPRRMVLAALREPSAEDFAGFQLLDFEFAGFDLFDRMCYASALLNCGGFPDVFSIEELSPRTGLLASRERAYQVRDDLRMLHPDEPHADCHVWALWRYVETT